MELTPLERLQTAVGQLAGPAREWHRDDLHNHALRYVADLALIQAIAPRGTVLELGAAPCHMTALLQLSGIPTVGLDVNPRRVRELSVALELDVRQCDIEREPLQFGDGTFDCVILCETFEHLRIDPAFVLSEINRVLVKGGTLLLTTPNTYSLPSLGRFLRGRSIAEPVVEYGKLRAIGHMGHVREYSAGEVTRFLQASGFSSRSLTYRYHPKDSRGARRLLQLLYKVLPKRFRREIVVLARKSKEGPGLQPLVPLAP